MQRKVASLLSRRLFLTVRYGDPISVLLGSREGLYKEKGARRRPVGQEIGLGLGNSLGGPQRRRNEKRNISIGILAERYSICAVGGEISTANCARAWYLPRGCLVSSTRRRGARARGTATRCSLRSAALVAKEPSDRK